jgi:alkanesulfonate monooxygenase SsuD/methylene tetrahydromethanopterin reductase-like flavin-dependent oxidoreductase (luciferase family)
MVSFEGEHYRLRGVHPGGAPPHPIGVWIGGYGPRMLRLIAVASPTGGSPPMA